MKKSTWMMVLAVLCASLVFAACGSDDEDASGSAAGGSSSQAEAGGGDDVVAKSQAYVDKFMEPPTDITISQKLKGKPEPGKSIVFLGTNDPNNVLLQNNTKKLAEEVGWDFSLVSYDPAKPNTFQAAIDTAISKKADYILEAGLPLTAAQIKKVKDSGAKWVLAAVAPVEVDGEGVLVNSGGPKSDEDQGRLLAHYFIANSGGKGKAIMEHVPSYPILQSFAKTFESEVEANCPDCSVDRVDVTLPQLAAGKIPSLMVSALRKNPDANYLVFDVGPFAGGVTAALKGAGLDDKVKIIGEAADEAAIAAIKDGSNEGWTAYDTVYSTYVMMHAMFLDSEGSTVNQEEFEVMPLQMLTKDTVPAGKRWSEPQDADAQFKALWGLG